MNFVGVNCGVRTPPVAPKPLIYGPGPSRKPDSALSRHPSPGLFKPRAPEGSSAYQPDRVLAGTIWLARTGGLPGRSLAGYRRWALTPPFHPSPVPEGVTPLRPSAGLLSVALDVAAGLRRAAPRVLSPSGLSGPGFSPWSSRVRTLLCIPEETPEYSGGSDGPDPLRNYTLLLQVLGSRRRVRAPPRLRRMILVGVRRNSTLSVPFQRLCQRGSSPMAGSNQMPGPSGSITPS